MTNCTSAAYVKTETKLLWPIEVGVVCDENQEKKHCDRSYKLGVHQKWNLIVGT